MEQQKGFFYTVLRKRNLVLILSAIIIAAGFLAYSILPKQQYPVVLTPAVTITAIYPGAAPDEMEEMVTKPIEHMVMQTDGYDFCFSQSMDSACVVVVRFGLGMSADELNASQTELRNKTSDLWANDLPSGVTSVQFNVAEINTAGMILTFTGESQSSQELAERADVLKNRLQKLEGVQKVEVNGNAEQRIVITVDMAKLNRMKLSLNALSSMIGYKNSIVPAGKLEFETDKITVNTSGMFEGIDEIRNIIVDVSAANGTVTRLKDIADIRLETDEDAKTFQYNGKDAVLLSLYYNEGVNIVAAGEVVNAEVAAYQAELPGGVELTDVFNMANDVSVSINDFIISVLQALLIVLVVVMAGMSFRNGCIVTVAIPVSLAVPFVVMLMTDIDVQFISLASLIIALGMLVDNAVVVSDAIQVRFDFGEERLSACANGVKSVAFPVLASTMTTVSIFIMFYMLPGTMQSFVFSLPTIVIAALMASYVVSLCVTPVMCYLLMKKTNLDEAGVLTKLVQMFRHRVLGQKQTEVSKSGRSILDIVGTLVSRLLNYGFDHKKQTAVAAIGMLIGSFGLLSLQAVEFIPKSEKEMLEITVASANPNDIRKTREAVETILQIIEEQPESTFRLSSVGGGIPKYDFAASDMGDQSSSGQVVFGINLKNGKRFNNKTDLLNYLQNEINHQVSGCRVTVKDLPIIPGDGEAIQIKVLGESFEEINQAAILIEEELAKIEGTMNIYSERQYEYPRYYVDMDTQRLNNYGLTKAEIQSELNAALMGRTATVYRNHNDELPIIIKSNISSSDDLGNLMIKSSSTGAKYPLKQLADIRLKSYYSTITRYDGERTVTVSASPKSGYSAMDIQTELKGILEQKEMGDVTLKYEGESKNMEEAQESMEVGVLIGVVGILMTLYIQFYSFRKVAIVFSAVPFCFVGASLGLFIFQPGFNLFTILGILSLFGVVVNNAIVLVDFIDKERASGVSLEAACKSAVNQRFRPVFLSTMTAVLGMLPLAMGNNSLFKGMAIAFMCGDALSMFFTLIIVPVVYGAWEGHVEKKQKLLPLRNSEDTRP